MRIHLINPETGRRILRRVGDKVLLRRARGGVEIVHEEAAKMDLNLVRDDAGVWGLETA